jgi:hypothetical protein
MDACLSGIAPELDRLTAVAQQLVAPLSDDQLNWLPAEGKWSIAQNIEHLAVINRLYSGAIAAALAGAAAGKRRDQPLLGGWLSRWLAREMEPPVRKQYRAPKSSLPSARINKQDLITEFLAAQEVVRRLIDDCWAVDINRTRFQNPFVKLLRFHVSGGLLILMAHLRRHIWQAEQIATTVPPAKALSQPVA